MLIHAIPPCTRFFHFFHRLHSSTSTMLIPLFPHCTSLVHFLTIALLCPCHAPCPPRSARPSWSRCYSLRNSSVRGIVWNVAWGLWGRGPLFIRQNSSVWSVSLQNYKCYFVNITQISVTSINALLKWLTAFFFFFSLLLSALPSEFMKGLVWSIVSESLEPLPKNWPSLLVCVGMCWSKSYTDRQHWVTPRRHFAAKRELLIQNIWISHS